MIDKHEGTLFKRKRTFFYEINEKDVVYPIKGAIKNQITKK